MRTVCMRSAKGMSKKKLSSPLMLGVCLVGTLLSGIAAAVGFMESLSFWKSFAKDPLSAVFMTAMVVLAIGVALFFLYGMNRICPVVWVEDGILHRRGLFFGYRRSCPVEGIQRIVSVLPTTGEKALFFEDGQAGVYIPGNKACYISLKDTPANRRFVADFLPQGNF